MNRLGMVNVREEGEWEEKRPERRAQSSRAVKTMKIGI